ncbi:hypothetical protein [Nonomuraea dietziae]|uniref:hypothetical protein n=1 Tax=Nonomuraea dietziae TaxID=65515 RepID=UPI003CD07E24
MGIDFSPGWNGTTDQEVFFMHTASEGNRVAKMNFNGTSPQRLRLRPAGHRQEPLPQRRPPQVRPRRPPVRHHRRDAQQTSTAQKPLLAQRQDPAHHQDGRRRPRQPVRHPRLQLRPPQPAGPGVGLRGTAVVLGVPATPPVTSST